MVKTKKGCWKLLVDARLNLQAEETRKLVRRVAELERHIAELKARPAYPVYPQTWPPPIDYPFNPWADPNPVPYVTITWSHDTNRGSARQ